MTSPFSAVFRLRYSLRDDRRSFEQLPLRATIKGIIAELRVTAVAVAERLPVPEGYSAAHVHGFVKKALNAKSDETFILEVSTLRRDGDVAAA